MKVQKSILAAALKRVASVVCNKSYLPVLAHVLLGNGRVVANCIDVACSVPCPTEGDTVIAIHHKETTDALAVLDGPEIEITVDGRKAVLRSGRRAVRVSTVDVDNMPSFSPGPATHDVDLSCWARVAYATGNKPDRPSLTQPALRPLRAGCGLVATDGHRLAHCRISDGHLPEVSVNMVAGAAIAAPCHIGLTEDTVTATYGDEVWTWKNVEGFPDTFLDVCPPLDGSVSIANLTPVVSVVKAAKKLKCRSVLLKGPDGTTSGWYMEGETRDNGVIITEALDIPPANRWVSTRLDVDYFGDALRVSPSGVLHIIDEQSVVTLVDGDLYHIIMPMRI